MTDYERYIAEEIATDHVDGFLSRREAMRRLGLLGLGTVAASALIAACAENAQPAAGGGSSSGPGAVVAGASGAPPSALPPGARGALPTTTIGWAGPTAKLSGAWAAASTPKGAVLVIHENKGLTDWVRGIAGRFAGIGYSALAIDLLAPEGGTASFTDPAAATAALGRIPAATQVANMKSGLDEIVRRVPGRKLAVVGFCMGGGLVWQLLAAGEPRLAAASPFYGPLPEGADFARSRQAAVLAFYGSLDRRVTSTEAAARAALEQAGNVHELVVEQGANHAFFNDTGDRYDPVASADAWKRLGGWLTHYVE
ncbi:dienelactone hydrolase family protein [Tsukamurella soli]|uniref:Dienelactone hydrolase family protein n=1 Tax=Tsukamurella soli TaxID=644556 RepID=A0ABP8J0Y6_9ACTN